MPYLDWAILHNMASERVLRIDLPEAKPVVTHFRIPVATRPVCRARVQGRHLEQTSNALGTAAVQLRPRLLGLATGLKHRLGVCFRKTASLILTLTGLVVTVSALPRSGHRLRRHAYGTYDRLVEAARSATVQHSDETG